MVRKQGKVDAGVRSMYMDRSELRKRALEVLSRANLESVYEAASLEYRDSAIDGAVKVMLAEKLVEGIRRAKRYARKARMKKVNASAILISSHDGVLAGCLPRGLHLIQ